MKDQVRRYAGVAAAALLGVALALPVRAQTKPAPPPSGADAAFGRITGNVTGPDGPVSYANILVLGTKLGALTDENGNFTIARVPVGTHQVQLRQIGSDPVVQAAVVNAGATATLTFKLGGAKVVKQFEEIIVQAERRIDTKSSATKQNISAEKLREIPVDNLSQAIATKAGIVASSDGLHFRGGRSGEVKFQFDGVEATDPAFGGSANIASLAVAGTDILSGGFDAEYGNALSGVVSVTTKEGSQNFGGEVRWDTDRYGDPTKTFNNFDRVQLGFGGPTPIRNLTYFATYEGTFLDTYLKSNMTKPRRTLIDFVQFGQPAEQPDQLELQARLSREFETEGHVRDHQQRVHQYALRAHVEPQGICPSAI